MRKLYYTFLVIFSFIFLSVPSSAQTWKPLGLDEVNMPGFSSAISNVIKISPGGVPYIAYSDGANGNIVVVKKYDGKKWVQVGDTFIEGHYSSLISLAFGADGSPYISYLPVIPNQIFLSSSVRKLVGDTWVKLNNLGGSSSTSLVLGTDDVPYVGYSYGGFGFTVKKFTNDWVNAGEEANISGSYLSYGKIAAGPDGTVYATYPNLKNRNKATVKKLVAGKWQLVGPEGFGNNGATDINIAVGADGTPYVAYKDSLAGGVAVVQQFKNNAWTPLVGSSISKGAANDMSLAVAPNGVVYIAFIDVGDNNRPKVKRYKAADWESVDAASLPVNQCSYTSIDIAKDGTPYLMYSDHYLNRKIATKVLVDGKWTDMVATELSQGTSANLIVKVQSSGVPLVAFSDAANGSKASVKQFVSGAWQYLGSPSLSASAIAKNDMDMDVSGDGTPYVVYRELNRASFIVKKFSGGQWTAVGDHTSPYSDNFFRIKVGPDGSVYVINYDSGMGGLVVRKFINGKWEVIGGGYVFQGPFAEASITIDKNNIPYVAYSTLGRGLVTVKALKGATWSIVGDPEFAEGAFDINMILGNDEVPYLSFSTSSGSKISVSGYINGTWKTVGGPISSTQWAIKPKLLLSITGQLYLAFIQYDSIYLNSTGKFLKLEQNVWVDAGNVGMVPNLADNNDIAFAPNGDIVYAYTNGQVFTRIRTGDNLAAPPVINSISPSFGTQGTVVTIKGYNFDNVSALKIGSAIPASFTVVSPTVISATIGASGTSGPVSLTTANGNVTSLNFTYNGLPPVIRSFSPLYGNVGTTVTIKGRNFAGTPADNQVYFGAVEGQVLTSNDSVLTVKVPVGANSAPVTVTTRKLTAYAATGFTVTFRSDLNFTENTFAIKKDIGNVVSPSGVTVKDMDNDGRPDILLIGGKLSVLTSTGVPKDLTFAPAFEGQRDGWYVSTGDLDGDGRADVATNTNVYVSKTGTTVAPILNTPQYLDSGSDPYHTMIQDLDMDGRPEVLYSNNWSSGVKVLRNTGFLKNYISFEQPLTVETDAIPRDFALADLDGDGKPDLIVTSRPAQVFINTSTAGKISFKNVSASTLATTLSQITLADVDNDGKADVVAIGNGNGALMVYRNTSTIGNISFTNGFSIATEASTASLTVADLNGDGLPDIAVSNNNNTISIFKNKSGGGTVKFEDRVNYKTNYQPDKIVAADLNGDQAPELIVSNYIGNNATIFVNSLASFTLPADNFKITAVSATCKGSANGSITLEAVQNLNYSAKLSGTGVNRTVTFTKDLKLNDLPAGNYSLCITVAGQSAFEQCFDVVISEPKDLALYSSVNMADRTVNLALTGATAYHIVLNGVNYDTANDNIKLPLLPGNNKLRVYSDKECQGVIDKVINLSGIISPYPNPFQNVLNVNIGLKQVSNVSVRLYNLISGTEVYNQQYKNKEGVLLLDVSHLKSGVYTMHLILDGTENIFKIAKP